MSDMDIAQLLRQLSQGRRDALDHLFPVVHDELRRIAHGQLRNERPGYTGNSTALVNATYLQPVGVDRVRDRGTTLDGPMT